MPETQKHLNAFSKVAQYIAGLTIQQDEKSEVGKAMVQFFDVDLVGFGERQSDGDIIVRNWVLSDGAPYEGMLSAEVKTIIIAVLESGFLDSQIIYMPDPYSIVFLPIVQADQTTAVMLIGKKTAEPISKDLLNIYLAIAGLAGAMIAKLESERDLRKRQYKLEDLVKKRTVELTRANKQLKRAQEKLKENAVQLKKANIHLQETNRLKTVFLATMSHELRTPLNSIIGFTGIVLQGLAGPLSDEQTKQLGIIRDNARHLRNLINDILDVSRIETDKLEITSEMFDMRETIEKVVGMMTPLAEKKDLVLVAEVSPEVGQITSDRQRVEQILVNLVNNSVKFTEKGEVRIECQISNGWLVTHVVDTGIGIKPKDMGMLFEAFRQTDNRHEGTGLGLFICKKLVEMLGGELRVQSEWGVGSTFTFTLPTHKT